VKESRKFELARLKKKKKEKHFAILFSANGCVYRHENTRRWTVGCYNGLWVSCFGDFEQFVYIACPRYPYTWSLLTLWSTDSMIQEWKTLKM